MHLNLTPVLSVFVTTKGELSLNGLAPHFARHQSKGLRLGIRHVGQYTEFLQPVRAKMLTVPKWGGYDMGHSDARTFFLRLTLTGSFRSNGGIASNLRNITCFFFSILIHGILPSVACTIVLESCYMCHICNDHAIGFEKGQLH